MLISRLSDIQASLPEQYQNDVIMRDNLLNAIRDINLCRLTYQKPFATLRKLIADLQTSVAFAPTTAAMLESAAHYVDRQ